MFQTLEHQKCRRYIQNWLIFFHWLILQSLCFRIWTHISVNTKNWLQVRITLNICWTNTVLIRSLCCLTINSKSVTFWCQHKSPPTTSNRNSISFYGLQLTICLSVRWKEKDSSYWWAKFVRWFHCPCEKHCQTDAFHLCTLASKSR